MQERNNICLYFHINAITNEVFYVGIGDKYRPYDKRHRNRFWTNTYNKYGYYIFIKSTNLSWEEACRREKIYIKHYGRRDLGLGNLCNLTDGGEGCYGIKQSLESIKKGAIARTGLKRSVKFCKRMSEIHKGKIISEDQKRKTKESKKGYKMSQETKDKIRKANLGRKMSIEAILKMIESNKGYKHSPESILKIKLNSLKKEVLQFDLNGNFIREYMSLGEAERQTNIFFTSIGACCASKRKTAGGFIWKFKQAGK